MDLPLELQLLILEFLLISKFPVRLNWTWAYDPSHKPAKFQRAFVTQPHRIDTSILRTNHHFYTEGCRILYEKNVFDFRQDCIWQERYGYKPETHVAQGFSEIIGPHNASSIRHICVIANEQHKLRYGYNDPRNSQYRLDQKQDKLAIGIIRSLCMAFQNVRYLEVRFNLARHALGALLREIAVRNISNIQAIQLFVSHRGQPSSYEFFYDLPAYLANLGWKFESYADMIPYWDPPSNERRYQSAVKYVRII